MPHQRVMIMEHKANVVEILGREFYTEPAVESSQTLRYQAATAPTSADRLRLYNLAATADGQHDFSDPNLNSYFPHIRMTRFRDWLAAAWASVP